MSFEAHLEATAAVVRHVAGRARARFALPPVLDAALDDLRSSVDVLAADAADLPAAVRRLVSAVHNLRVLATQPRGWEQTESSVLSDATAVLDYLLDETLSEDELADLEDANHALVRELHAKALEGDVPPAPERVRRRPDLSHLGVVAEWARLLDAELTDERGDDAWLQQRGAGPVLVDFETRYGGIRMFPSSQELDVLDFGACRCANLSAADGVPVAVTGDRVYLLASNATFHELDTTFDTETAHFANDTDAFVARAIAWCLYVRGPARTWLDGAEGARVAAELDLAPVADGLWGDGSRAVFEHHRYGETRTFINDMSTP